MASKQNPVSGSAASRAESAAEVTANPNKARPVSGFAPKGTQEALEALGRERAPLESGMAPASRELEVPHSPPPAPNVQLLTDVSPAATARPPQQSQHRRPWFAVMVIGVAIALGAMLGYALRSVDGLGRSGGVVRRAEPDMVPPAEPASDAPAVATAESADVPEVVPQDAMPAAEASKGIEEAETVAPAVVESTRRSPRPNVPRGSKRDEPSEASAELEPVDAPEPPAQTAKGDPLAQLPPRTAVVAGFEEVRLRLAACAGERRGVAEVHATISGQSGRVTHALIRGDFQGTPEGSCMARAVRAATFPQFARPQVKVEYPFAL